MDDSVQMAIATLLSQKAGFDAGSISASRLTRAISSRLAAYGFTNAQAYLSRVQSSLPEWEALIEALVVPETWFFRDRKPFDYLKQYITAEGAATRRLRLLSVPCSTGEEPYSLAIALLQAGLSPDQFVIDAIDISHHAIAKAKCGVYTKNSFRGEAWNDRDRYFQQTSEGFQLDSSILKLVNFQQGNVLTLLPSLTQQYDVIFCRNLLIYLHQDACMQVLQAIDRRLSPQGLLFMGSAETGRIDMTQYTSVRQPFTFAFRKLAAPPPPPKSPPKTPPQRPPSAVPQPYVISHNAIPPIAPPSPVPDLQTVNQLVEAGQVTEAIALCQTYLSHNRTSSEAHLLLGQLYQTTQQDLQAEQYFQRTLYLQPDSQAALLSLVALKERQGDRASADRLQQRLERLQHHLKSQSSQITKVVGRTPDV